jgi:hypothetical protein
MQSGGPFIVVDYENYDRASLTFLDLKGSAQWVVELPQWEENYSRAWEGNVISPDWKWYAYVTGTVSGGKAYPAGGVVLHLMNLLTGEVRDIADLIPEDYWARQTRMVEQSDLEGCKHNSADCLSIAVTSLNASAYSMAWSPDGKYLAFGAMLDGDSADVYLYDIDTGKIQSLEEGPWNAHSIHWSPDGQWILFKDLDIPASDPNAAMGKDWPYSLWAIRRNGTGLRNLRDNLQFYFWFSDYEYVAWFFYPQRTYSDPIVVNIQTGNIYNLFEGEVSTVSISRRHRIVLLGIPYPNFRSQYYYGEVYKKLISGPLCADAEKECSAMLREGITHSILYSVGDQWFGITPNGTIVPLSIKGWQGKESPSNWLTFSSQSGVDIYDPSDKLRYALNNCPADGRMTWDTNSQGIFYFDGSGTSDSIYYWKFSESAPRVVAPLPKGYMDGFLYISPILILKTLPHLRILPTRAEKPAEGTSIWSQTKYKELFQPGTNRYDVTIPADSSWRWSFSLGTTDPNLFEKILLPEDVEFRINGEWIDSNMFRMSDQTVEGRFSRAWAAMLSGWRPGDRAELEIKYTLRENVRDGNVEYPAGEYRQIISVVVE